MTVLLVLGHRCGGPSVWDTHRDRRYYGRPALEIPSARSRAGSAGPATVPLGWRYQPAASEIEIVVDGGYKPAQVEVRQGERVRLKFVRKEYSGCTREVVIPVLGIRRELPPNKVVTIDLPALAPGEYEFRCGMNMTRGAIVVRPS